MKPLFDNQRAFNLRPLVPAAMGILVGVIMGMHIQGAAALFAALLLCYGATVSKRYDKTAFFILFLGVLFGFLRMLPYVITPEPINDEIEAARYTTLGTPKALLPLVNALRNRCDVLFMESSPIARALLLNDRTKLTYFQTDIFRTAGVSHTLALSGLHISALSAVLMWLIPKNKPGTRAITVSLFMLFYCAVAGFPYSLMRAAIMFLCILFAPLFCRKADTLSSLALSFCIILTISPFAIYSAGFCLSFSAVLGIALLYAPIMSKLPKAFAPVVTTVAATLGTLPFTAAYFSTLPLYSLISNIFIVPLTTLALIFGMIALCISFIWFKLGAIIALPARLILLATETVGGAISALPYALIKVEKPTLLGGVLFYCALIALSNYCMLSRNKKLVLSSLFIFLSVICLIIP